MGKNEKITVIVPVYNVEKYLAECIESLLEQTYQNFELILIDDCSPDRSGIVCDQFAEKDPRIRVIHKEKNEGLSAARNTGVQMATGSYMCFVDSDDILMPDFLRILYENAAQYHADLSYCCFQQFNNTSELQKEWFHQSSLVSSKQLYEYLTETSIGCKKPEFVISTCKLIRSSIAQSLSFPYSRWHEDEFYINGLVQKVNTVVETSECLYCYRQREDSITGNDNRIDRRHLDVLDAIEERVRICRKLNRRLYHRSLTAYRFSICDQYRTFSTGKIAVQLKVRFILSFLKYPTLHFRGLKGWTLFLLNSKHYYRKYWS